MSGGCCQHKFSILQKELEVRFEVPVNSSMLTKVSLKGLDVKCCLAAPSAALGCLSHCFLWSGLESPDVIVQILSCKYQTCLLIK